MKNILRKIVLPATIIMFCALIGASAYVASKNIKIIQQHAAQRLDASDVQSDIAAVQLDLQAIETGQHGYLLTGDASYLEPYSQATANLPVHFSTLRSRLAGRPSEERAVESDLEALAKSKIAESDETIRLRQKGYRHRAFLIVDSNRGKELMDKARSLLGQLSAVETRNVAEYDAELNKSVLTALGQSALAGLVLIGLTVITLLAFHRSRKRLEVAYANQTKQLRASSQELERFTSMISQDVRGVAVQMRGYAENLLHAYAGFLPRQGEERVEWLHEGSCEINRLLDELLGDARSGQVASGKASRTVELTAPSTRPRSQTA